MRAFLEGGVDDGPTGTAETCGWLERPPGRLGLSSSTQSRRAQFWPLVRAAECRHSLPAGLLDAVVIAESAYRPYAVSRAGAGGLAQLMPGTARDLGIMDRFDPLDNIEGGARYLRQMLDRFRSVPLALAAYNAGPHAVARVGRIPRNRETPAYVDRVLSLWSELGRGTSPDASPPPIPRRAVRLEF